MSTSRRGRWPNARECSRRSLAMTCIRSVGTAVGPTARSRTTSSRPGHSRVGGGSSRPSTVLAERGRRAASFMSSRAPQLTVVIPVYNEEAIVASAATELAAGLDARGWDYEIILAENGSKDATPQILEALSADHPRVRWFHCETPNYGTALRRGILDARGELVVCDEIDLCDLSFYDQALPMLQAREADLVIGSKAAKGASDRRP